MRSEVKRHIVHLRLLSRCRTILHSLETRGEYAHAVQETRYLHDEIASHIAWIDLHSAGEQREFLTRELRGAQATLESLSDSLKASLPDKTDFACRIADVHQVLLDHVAASEVRGAACGRQDAEDLAKTRGAFPLIRKEMERGSLP